jgi:hypothetical protein
LRNSDIDADQHCDGDGNSDINGHGNKYADQHCDGNSDGNSHGHRNMYTGSARYVV